MKTQQARGFTLIELMVVMSIIALLLTIAVPRYLSSVERSKEAVLQSDLFIMREALDPSNPDPIALPPDQELLADLCAVRYKVVTLGSVAAIQMRDKDEIRQMLGRSPDKGDAVAMTFVSGIPEPGAVTQSKYEEHEPEDWRM